MSLAAIVRMVYAFGLAGRPFLTVPILDARYYYEWAHKILTGVPLDHGVFLNEPLYAYALALILRSSPFGYPTILALQFVLGSLLPVMLLKIGERVFNRPIGLLAGLLAAIYGPFVFYEGLVLKTSLEACGIVLFVLLAVQTAGSPVRWRYGLLGLCLGILAMLKANNLIWLPILLLWIGTRSPAARGARAVMIALVSGGFLLGVAPTALHNYVVGRDAVLISYSLGLNLYHGNHRASDGSFVAPQFLRFSPEHEEADSFLMAEAYTRRSLKPSEVSAFWMRKAFAEILYDPFRWVALEMRKFLLLVTKAERGDNYDYKLYARELPLLRWLPNFWLIAALSLTGIALLIGSRELRAALWSRSDSPPTLAAADPAAHAASADARRRVESVQQLFLWLTASYALLLLAFHVNGRYRVPLVPLLLVLCALTVWDLLRSLRQGRLMRSGVIVGLALVWLAVSASAPGHPGTLVYADFYDSLGSAYWAQKDYPKALASYQRAVQENPRHEWAYLDLFRAYLHAGQFHLAKWALQQAMVLRPDDMSTYANLKLLNELEGKPLDVIQARLSADQERTTPSKPPCYDPYLYEVLQRMQAREYDQLEPLFVKSTQACGESESALLNWAYVRKQRHDLEGAKELLRKAIALNPDFLAAKYNLANIYLQVRAYAQAAVLLQEIYDVLPEYGETWLALGKAYLKSGNDLAGRAVLRACVTRFENDPATRFQAQAASCRALLGQRAAEPTSPFETYSVFPQRSPAQ